MSEKTKKVTWHVLASIEGRQWPIGVETEIPSASIQEMNEALESVAAWFLKNNIFPNITPDTSPPPFLSERGQMPEEETTRTLAPAPECPHCKKAMSESKHQETNGTIQHYCPTRFGDGSYCRWRASLDPVSLEKVTWQIKEKDGGK